ncbi:DNA gyrase subunit A [Arthrobacter sp. UM1]|uniref:DNA gyrase subunit A n=1 Tax=Arthrobacter sp. UM1 TaxID=2766776 RepID=UPI001CF6F23A|nr:DNA gyrase subunit A [Arthrobacter sp. UM1]MCB4208639.1 DNA gyrase subunit A [Arthrobacter sp. UM1]
MSDNTPENPENENPENGTPENETPETEDRERELPADAEEAGLEDEAREIKPEPVVVPEGHDKIEQIDLQEEMQRSYLDYAMAVIVGRALPDVRDGLKPVHRRVLYAMYDGGYRPDRAFNKCARVVGDVMGTYHPHGDLAIYDALVRLIQDWTMRYPLALGQGNFGSPGNDGAAAPRYTETKMAPLAMEMVRDIDEETVDFKDNYDGKNQEPVVLPSRFPNLLVNGSSGIAVGMATNIPPHNLREVADGVQWALKNPEASREELLDALLERIKGPDFPTGATILGHKGIEDAYRTGRGSITMRAVVNVEEIQGRTCLVVTELPYQANPDNLAIKIAELVKDGKIKGIADLRDETSGRTGQRLVIVLKRDAVAKVVLNNLYKHTQLQENFSANMLAIVDGVPRTLSLDAFVRHWVAHQMDVIVRRTKFRLRKAEEQAHILLGLLKALDALDEVIALIRRSPTVDDARNGLKELLDIDDVQAQAILDMQLRRLAALERQKIQDQYARLMEEIADYKEILATPQRQRDLVSDELQEIVDRYGDDRRTEIVRGLDGDVNMEDLIPEEEMVVTITRGGYVKRTRIDQYRSQARGGKGVRGAQLREDDVVEQFFVTTTHHWLLFFTNLGRVYRAKAYELAEGGRDAKGQHVANLLAFQPDERIAQVMELRDYDVAPYLLLATRNGLVKKTRLEDYDTNRAAGVIAINLREGDELVAARLISEKDDLLLVSREGMSVRFTATDETLRPTGRATSGVTGMKFRGEDHLLSADVITDEGYVFVVTEGGYAKRTHVSEYRSQGRGGLGIKVAKLADERGVLVSGMIVGEDDDVLVVMKKGKIVRSRVDGVPAKGRNTMGVIFAKPDKGDSIIAVAKNSERHLDEEIEQALADSEDGAESGDGKGDGVPLTTEPAPGESDLVAAEAEGTSTEELSE